MQPGSSGKQLGLCKDGPRVSADTGIAREVLGRGEEGMDQGGEIRVNCVWEGGRFSCSNAKSSSPAGA